MIKDSNDFAAGILFIAVGLVYGAFSLNLIIGSALNMGPGFFPLVLCGLLVLLGSAILAKSFFGSKNSSFGKLSWRAIVMLPLSIVIFGASLKYIGLLPAVFITALMASFSSGKTPLKMAVVISALIAVFATLIFVYGVGLPIPVLGIWFTN